MRLCTQNVQKNFCILMVIERYDYIYVHQKRSLDQFDTDTDLKRKPIICSLSTAINAGIICLPYTLQVTNCLTYKNWLILVSYSATVNNFRRSFANRTTQTHFKPLKYLLHLGHRSLSLLAVQHESDLHMDVWLR